MWNKKEKNKIKYSRVDDTCAISIASSSMNTLQSIIISIDENIIKWNRIQRGMMKNEIR